MNSFPAPARPRWARAPPGVPGLTHSPNLTERVSRSLPVGTVSGL
jgi:hypothetical protein